MAIVSEDHFFFYFQGSQVLAPSHMGPSQKTDFYDALPEYVVKELKADESQSLVQVLQNKNYNLQQVVWGLWYCDVKTTTLDSPEDLYIWPVDGNNKFTDQRYTEPLIKFGQNGGRVGVALGGNPPEDGSLVNPIEKLYDQPGDFTALLKKMKRDLEGQLHIIDLDIENPQLDDVNEEWWITLNKTLKSVKKDDTCKDIQVVLTIPQASAYWMAKKGYTALNSSGILEDAESPFDFVNIMDMDKTPHKNPQTWINWVQDTVKTLKLNSDSVYVTFESKLLKGETPELFVDVMNQLGKNIEIPVNKFGSYTVENAGIPEFMMATK